MKARSILTLAACTALLPAVALAQAVPPLSGQARTVVLDCYQASQGDDNAQTRLTCLKAVEFFTNDEAKMESRVGDIIPTKPTQAATDRYLKAVVPLKTRQADDDIRVTQLYEVIALHDDDPDLKSLDLKSALDSLKLAIIEEQTPSQRQRTNVEVRALAKMASGS